MRIDWTRRAKELGYADEVEMLDRLYTARRLSNTAIARIVGTSPSSVLNKLRELSVPVRKRGGRNNYRTVDISYDDYCRFTYRELAMINGVSLNKIYMATRHYPSKVGKEKKHERED